MKYIVQSKENPNKYWAIKDEATGRFSMGYNSNRTNAQVFDQAMAEEIAKNYDGVVVKVKDVRFYQ